MSDFIHSLIDQFEFNSIMVKVGLPDLSNEDATFRMREGEGASISYTVGHLASSRYGILKMIGATDENPFAEAFGGQAGARDGSEYPPISELIEGWDQISEIFPPALRNLTDEDVLKESPSRFPIPDNTIRGGIMFLAWHECYHLGQMGLIRRQLGYAPLQERLYEFMGKKG